MIERYFLPIIDYVQRHQGLFFSTIIALVFGILVNFQYQSYSKRHLSDLSDQYFQIIAADDYPAETEMLSSFKSKNPSSIYSDLIRLQQAKYYYDQKDIARCIELLEATVKHSYSKSIRSLAAYRMAVVLKPTDARRALDLTNKIEIKSLNLLKSLIKAELFESLGEKSKALLELNSVSTDSINQSTESADDIFLIEQASRHKRRLLNDNV
tara:strand:- start:2678 stop:3310 length:633 start_codon:yes stop_codon:yes gene_type:complete